MKSQSAKCPTFRFLVDYIDMVKCLLSFIRATRESIWDLHINTLRHLLPWLFEYDHTNYARYGALYYMEMINLNQTHAGVAEVFRNQRGSVTYPASHHTPFPSVACDQEIGQTINRHTKSQGGVIGFTIKPFAAARWTATHLERTAIHEDLQGLLSLDKPMFEQHSFPKNLGMQKKKDEAKNERCYNSSHQPFQP